MFEENDGSLKNVHAAVARGRQMVRARAGEGPFSGAGVGPDSSRDSSGFEVSATAVPLLTVQDSSTATKASLFLFVLSGLIWV